MMTTTEAVVMQAPYEEELKEAALKVREAAEGLKAILLHAAEANGKIAVVDGSISESIDDKIWGRNIEKIEWGLLDFADKIWPEAGFIP